MRAQHLMGHQMLAAVLVAVGLFCSLQSGSVSATQALAGKPTLESLCNDKQVSLTKISEARKLIEENRSGQHAECAKYSESLEELDGILTVAQSGKICDLNFVDKIRAYHENFIASSNNKPRDNIPKSLRHFFISLCFQISAECKMTLINNLEYDTKEQLTEEDYDEIQFLENYGATLLDSDTEISDFDDILLLNDLNQAAGLKEQTGESRLLIKVKTNNMMRKLVENCNNKFKPFYDKLIMPLIKLSNLGYNYQGELLEREMKELRHNSLVRRWYNIVQTCEAFRTIQIYEDPEMNQLGNGRQALTFISGDEADSLRNRNVKTIEEEIAAQEAKEVSEGDLEAAKKVVYEPVTSPDSDELWIKDQKELEKLVHKYKASSSEADRVRSKLIKKLIARMKETIMSGKVLVFASEMVKSKLGGNSESDSSSVTSMNEDMIMMMDEAVEQEEINKGEASAEALEGAVSGAKRRAAKIVSRAGPVSNVLNMGLPARTKLIPRKVDGTKSTTKFFNFGAKFLPRRMNIFMWIIAICGFLMIITAIFAG